MRNGKKQRNYNLKKRNEERGGSKRGVKKKRKRKAKGKITTLCVNVSFHQ